MPTSHLPNKRASDLIEEKLARMIISLELPPGAMITEADLSQRLECGRTPLREALQRLAQQYLVVSVPRHGIFIAELNLLDYVQLIEAIALLESGSAVLAASRLGEADIAELKENIDHTEIFFTAGDFLSVAEHDFKFHQKISQISRNKYLIDMTLRLHRLTSRFIYISLTNGMTIKTSLDEHHEIIEALENHAEEQARKLTYEHMLKAKERIISVL
jgi:GntR family transcriptional regulator, rspAB operon transcriptional repressor